MITEFYAKAFSPEIDGIKIKGYSKYVITIDGIVWSKQKGDEWRKLIQDISPNGYSYVRLYDDSKICKRIAVAHLILTCTGNIRQTSDMQACHNDGNKRNNHLSNLRWGTPTENAADRTRHGVSYRGMKNPKVKLCNNDIASIRQLHNDGVLTGKISEMFRVSKSTIQRILGKKSWTHI